MNIVSSSVSINYINFQHKSPLACASLKHRLVRSENITNGRVSLRSFSVTQPKIIYVMFQGQLQQDQFSNLIYLFFQSLSKIIIIMNKLTSRFLGGIFDGAHGLLQLLQGDPMRWIPEKQYSIFEETKYSFLLESRHIHNQHTICSGMIRGKR